MFPPENFPYLIERKVGEGAMGAVYAAIDPDLNRRVAIKVMHPGNPEGTEEARLRFLQEARAAAALSHTGGSSPITGSRSRRTGLPSTRSQPGIPFSRLARAGV